MAYSIDKSLSWDGLFKITTDSGSIYMIKIKESAKGSNLWHIELIRPSGNPPAMEIFKTMRYVSEVCKEYMNTVNGNQTILFITGDEKESLQKSNVFKRWMGDDWEAEIIRPEIKFNAVRNANILPTNFALHSKRKEKTVEMSVENTIMEPTITSEIKFCFNCGTPNNNFSFCPNCGTKLKQA